MVFEFVLVAVIESERFPDPVLNGFLYSFGAKQVSKIMKINDFRIQFGADFYIALVRNKCGK